MLLIGVKNLAVVVNGGFQAITGFKHPLLMVVTDFQLAVKNHFYAGPDKLMLLLDLRKQLMTSSKSAW